MGLRDSSTRNVFFWGWIRLSLIFRLFFLALRPFSLVTSYFSPRSSYRFLKGSMEPITIAKRSLKPKFLRFHCRKKKWWCRFSFFIISLMASGHTMFVVGICSQGWWDCCYFPKSECDFRTYFQAQKSSDCQPALACHNHVDPPSIVSEVFFGFKRRWMRICFKNLSSLRSAWENLSAACHCCIYCSA